MDKISYAPLLHQNSVYDEMMIVVNMLYIDTI